MTHLVSILLLWAFVSQLSAWNFYGNQSQIHWKTAETQHYEFVYPVEYQDRVGEIASFAEAVHDSIEQRYRIQLPGKSTVIIRNSLFSNGLASPISNTMNLWLTDWDFKVRSTHRWMYDVFTHEFSHLVSMQTGTKLAPWIHGLQITQESYSNAAVGFDAAVQVPFAIFPYWFAEGTAQFESSRMGYDGWDTHRDMLLRVAVLNDSLLPLSKMRKFSDNALEAEMGPYTQGFALVRYMAQRFGDQVIPDLWSEMSRVHRLSFSEACRLVTGFSEEEIYSQWKAERLATYQDVKQKLGVLREGTKRSKSAFWHDVPQSDNGSLWGISNFGSSWFEGGLFRMPPIDSLTEDQKADSLGQYDYSSFAQVPFELTKPWLDKGFSVRGNRIAYSGYANRDRNGNAYFDIFVDDSTEGPWFGERKTLRRVTKFADAIYPDISPDTQSVVFVRREMNGVRFYLSVADIPQGTATEEWMDLLTPPDSAKSFNLYTPKWSPDGKWIAFSLYDGLSRKVAMIGKDGKGFRVLTPDIHDSRDPAWSPDGKLLYFSSNRSGIFNIWKLNPLQDTLQMSPITNVLGGAFNPLIHQGNLWYVGYDKDGFSLYEIEKSDSLQILLPEVQRAPLSEVVSVGDVEVQGVSRAYSPLPVQPILVPLLSYAQQSDPRASLRDSRSVTKIGAALGLMDPLQKNSLQFALLMEMGQGWDLIDQTGLNPAIQSDLYAMWENRSFPVTLGMGYLRRNLTSEDTVHYEDPRSHHDSLYTYSPYAITIQALQAQAGYSVFKQGDSLVLGVTSQWAKFHLYKEGFFWDYLRSRSASASLFWGGAGANYSGISGSANGVGLTYQLSQSDLYRPGSFSESFTITSEGILSPNYRHFLLHEAWLSASYGIHNPWHAGARLSAAGSMSGILQWSGTDLGTDTLDHFFHHSATVSGYPQLTDDETLQNHGERSALAELHYAFPLYTELEASLWILSIQDLYMDLFAQAGASWSDGGSFWDEFKNQSNVQRSIGFELRASNDLFHTQPFVLYLQWSRALDSLKSGRSVSEVSIPLMPSFLEPTGIRFGIGYSFNGLVHAQMH